MSVARITTPMTAAELDQLAINTIRILSIDAVHQAKSGYPGTPTALAPLVFHDLESCASILRTRSGRLAIGSCARTAAPRCCSDPCST